MPDLRAVVVVAPYSVMMGLILVLTPLVCWAFSFKTKDSRTPFGKMTEVIHKNRYYLHILGYAVIIKWKTITDGLNEPMKSRTGNWTEYIYAIEGNFSLYVQRMFENDLLTDFLNFHYLFIYLFIIYVTTVFYAYVGERDLTDKVTLNYLLIYAVAVPYYLFFNIEVTSSWIPGMKALLYHQGWYTEFYVLHDPLDNAIPSLHIAIPFGILLLNWLHVKERGGKMREWEHWPYHLFILVNTLIFCFSIIYLGIHWIIDIPFGLLIGAIGALFVHYIQPRLRNDFGNWRKGMSKTKVQRHFLVEGLMAAMMVVTIILATSSQAAGAETRASFRLGEGDTKFEIVPKFNDGVEIVSQVTNLNEETSIHVLSIGLYDSIDSMDRNGILWNDLVAESGGEVILAPGEKANFTFDDPMQWKLLVFHMPDNGGDEVVELNVISTYSDDSITSALMMSLISLWITAFVAYRIFRLKKAGLPIICSVPSHAWDALSEES
jgi:membrane-associated phospholipid phosphatase